MDSIGKIASDTKKDNNALFDEIEKFVVEKGLENDMVYYVLINSLYNNNLFKYFKTKSSIIKRFLEKDSKKEESSYHIVVAIIDLTIKRYAKDFGQALAKHTPSILYVLYEEDIISEDWYQKFYKGIFKNVKNIFFDKDSYEKFIKNAEEFTKWLETAPCEEDLTKPANQNASNNEKKTKIEIDIDNI